MGYRVRLVWRCVIVLVLMPVWSLAAESAEVTLYAAASLTQALTVLKTQYEQQKPVTIKASFAGSSTLARQIEAGAPAQIYASADSQWMDYLQQRGKLLPGSRRHWLGNKLVLIAPRAQPFFVRLEKGGNLPDAFTGRLCTGDPASVPVGLYAREALQSLGWWNALEKRIVPAADVRATLAFVERGDCAAGIVYDTDARTSDKVMVVARFPAGSHTPIVYPFALLTGASPAAAAFYQYLQSDAARAVFGQYGFAVLPVAP